MTVRSLTDCTCPQYEYGWRDPAWSPQGNYVAYVGENAYPPIYELWEYVHVQRPDGQPADWPYFGLSGEVSHPAWAPDESRMVLVVNGGLLAQTKEGEEIPLTGASEYAYTEPAWSPDGSTLACTREGNIWLLAATGGPGTQLTTAGGHSPSWSPDGAFITYAGSDGFVYIIPVVGGSPRRLLAGGDPAWSAGGTWIAFVNGELWVTAATGGTPVQLTSDGKSKAQPTWSPDGRSIAYTEYGTYCSCIRILSDLPDFRLSVSTRTWGAIKSFYR